MSRLTDERAAYESMQRNLELDHMGKWVVFHSKELSGIYVSCEEAAEEAAKRFGSGPY